MTQPRGAARQFSGRDTEPGAERGLNGPDGRPQEQHRVFSGGWDGGWGGPVTRLPSENGVLDTHTNPD